MQRPSSNVIKIDLAAPLAYDETMESQDNGQEEWLSEEGLTDEDFNQSMEQDQYGNTSLEDSHASMGDEPDAETMDETKITGMEDEDLTNMEANLNNLENDDYIQNKHEKSEDSLNAELGMFLIRKSDGKVDVVQERKMSSEYEEQEKKDNERGNDTDELLRMLGEDDNKTKKLQKRRTLNENKVVRPIQEDSTDDDLESARLTTMNVSKNVSFIKKYPKKAEPENSDTGTKVTTMKDVKHVSSKKYPTRASVPQDKSESDDGAKMTTMNVVKNVSSKKYPTRAVPEKMSDSDDGAKVTTMKVARNVSSKKYPTRAVPEKMSDSDDVAKVTTMKVAKNVSFKKYPTRAVPENVSDSDDSVKMTTMKVTKNVSSKKYPTRAAPENMSDSDDDAKVTPMKVAKNVSSKKYPTRAAPEKSDSDDDAKVTAMKVAKHVSAKKYPTRASMPQDKSESDGAAKVTSVVKLAKHVSSKKYPTRASVPQDKSESDDGAKATTMKDVKHVSSKKYPTRASVPQDKSETDDSAGETHTLQNIFRLSSSRKANFASKSTAKSSITAIMANPKSLLRVPNKPAEKPVFLNTVTRPPTSTPVKQYSSKVKGIDRKPIQSTPVPKPAATPTSSPVIKLTTNVPAKPVINPPEMDDDDEDDDDDFDMDEFADDLSEDEENSQRLRRPEMMDEEVPTDDETDPSDLSFYDELPSSESEEVEEWFALDIRAERAGDYIPLLGHKAYELLTEEKKRVDSKLTSLRSSISSLADKSRVQTKEIEEARRSLAAIDALLTHT